MTTEIGSPAARLTLANHPKWVAAQERLNSLAREQIAMTARQDQLRENLKAHPVGARAAARAAWDATSGDSSVATMEKDTATARDELKSNGERLATLEQAQRHGAEAMYQYLDGGQPLRLEVSSECCRASGPEFLDATRHVRAAVMTLATAVQAAEAILADLESNGTMLCDPLRRCWGPLGDIGSKPNALTNWLDELSSYISEMAPASKAV